MDPGSAAPSGKAAWVGFPHLQAGKNAPLSIHLRLEREFLDEVAAGFDHVAYGSLA